MYIYRYSFAGGCYTVGYYTPKGAWEPESDWETPAQAVQRCALLNGDPAPATTGTPEIEALRNHERFLTATMDRFQDSNRGSQELEVAAFYTSAHALLSIAKSLSILVERQS